MAVTVSIIGFIWFIVWITPQKVLLTNDQIIAETKKCEENGLVAKSNYYGEYGIEEKVKSVICRPKDFLDISKSEKNISSNIKKSNITTVNVQLPTNNSSEE